jgi:hypothetical protein
MKPFSPLSHAAIMLAGYYQINDSAGDTRAVNRDEKKGP